MIKNPFASLSNPDYAESRVRDFIRKSERAEMQERRRSYNEISDAIDRAFDPSRLAQAIVRAGQKRRGEIQEPIEPDDTAAGRLAKQIIAAGRKARGET